jgi:hypothetical protein
MSIGLRRASSMRSRQHEIHAMSIGVLPAARPAPNRLMSKRLLSMPPLFLHFPSASKNGFFPIS